ncbi:MAG: DUF1638 domain-containing protein, partial [Desulfuromonadales bacterium]|nr:DUF1638 domain-containing protein [Desulfuromonadales bacterium]
MYQHKKLTLAFCENFLPEAKAVLEQSEFPDVNLISWKPCCEHPPKDWDEFASLLDVQGKTPLLIVGACFTKALQDSKPPEHLGDIHLKPLEQCFHLISGKTQINTLVSEREHLVSPGWLAHWQNHLEQWGFDQEHARIFFNDMAKKITFLDTGVIDKASSQAEEFADYVGLPCSKIDIGLDFITGHIRTLILEWQNNSLKMDFETSQENTANHAMALTLLESLTGKTSENEAIEGVVELFRV